MTVNSYQISSKVVWKPIWLFRKVCKPVFFRLFKHPLCGFGVICVYLQDTYEEVCWLFPNKMLKTFLIAPKNTSNHGRSCFPNMLRLWDCPWHTYDWHGVCASGSLPQHLVTRMSECTGKLLRWLLSVFHKFMFCRAGALFTVHTISRLRFWNLEDMN